MKVFSYSPSVDAYVVVGKDRNTVDLSKDVVSCNVTRKSDGASTFSMTLQNVDWKYNGMFSCFDPIVIYCTKDVRIKLFTGYVTQFDAFSLYQGDFHISGLCTIYRLQNYYWDPLLLESQLLWQSNAYNNGRLDNGYADQVVRLLTKVCGWPESAISIGSVPQDAIAFAREMYASNLDSSNQLKSMIDEFYEILRTHGPKFSAASSSSSSDGISDDQRKIIEVATSGTVPGSGGMCLQWVNDVCQAAGFPFERFPGAIDVWDNYSSSGGTDVSNAPPAALMVGSGSGSAGAMYGHIGIKLYGDDVISEVGGQRTESVTSFYSWQTATCRGITGAAGWVKVPGVTYGGGSGSYSGIDFDMPEAEFVRKWGDRINAWIAGHYPNGALNGHGATIAREARRNGVDPRIVVAIATGESGCGSTTTSGGSHGIHNYWSWGIAGMSAGIWASDVDGAIAEFCEKFGRQYAGCSPAECAAKGYGEADYIMANWQPVIDAI